jgi:hypothetical protein
MLEWRVGLDRYGKFTEKFLPCEEPATKATPEAFVTET